MLSNPVVISIVVLLALSLLRVNVVIALVISALTAGLCGDLGLGKTIEAGLVILQHWAERKRKILIITPTV